MEDWVGWLRSFLRYVDKKHLVWQLWVFAGNCCSKPLKRRWLLPEPDCSVLSSAHLTSKQTIIFRSHLSGWNISTMYDRKECVGNCTWAIFQEQKSEQSCFQIMTVQRLLNPLFFLCKMMIKIEYILEKKKNIKNMLVKAAELGKKCSQILLTTASKHSCHDPDCNCYYKWLYQGLYFNKYFW